MTSLLVRARLPRATVWSLFILAALAVAAGLAAVILARSPYLFVDSDQVLFDPGRTLPSTAGQLAAGPAVGQTFVARHAGLAGIEFYLVPAEQGTSQTITLQLRDSPHSTEALRTAALHLPAEAAPGFFRFTFPPVSDSHGRYYYAFLEAPGQAAALALADGGAYLDGAAHLDHQPLDAQTAFRLVYAPASIALDLVTALGRWLALLAAAALLFVLPGWALLAWLMPAGHQQTGVGLVALAAGLGLAIYPLLFLWTDAVSLHLGPWYVWLILPASIAALVWRYRTFRPRLDRARLRSWARPELLWPNLTLLLVLGLIFAVRMLVVGTIDVPMWGDSYQHTMIVQLLEDHGGLFNSWEPYAPLRSFTYHFGFHASVAAYGWLAGLEASTAVLWMGQILNGLAILVLYPLATRVSGNRWAGVVAVLIAGLLSPMPMTYTNWGRYPQLLGQVLLPVAIVFTWSALDAPRRDWRLLVVNWIVVSGLALTHLRVLILYALFVLAWLVLAFRRSSWRAAFGRLAWLGLGVALLCVPWFVRLFTGRLVPILWEKLTTPAAQLTTFDQQANSLGNLTTYLGSGLWLLLLLALGIGLWQRRPGVRLLAVWWFLILVAANPEWLHLPGTGIVSNFALLIAIYIPASLLIGDLASQALVGPVSHRLPGLLMPLLVLAIGLGGVQARLGDIRPALHTLVTRPDLRAMAWVEANTPADSRFLVNGFFAYGGTILVGSDGGWWLPVLAGRENTIPPINYGLEAWPTADYRQQVHELPQALSGQDLGEPEALALLRQHGVTHIYVGQQQGRVNYGGSDVIDPDQLLSTEQYGLLYHQDRVWIFELVP